MVRKKRLRKVAVCGMVIVVAILGVLVTVAQFNPQASPTSVNLSLAQFSDIGVQTCTPWPTCQYPTSVTFLTSSPIHVADTWQEWYDGNTFNQLLSGNPSQVRFQWFPNFQAASPQAPPTTGFILRIPVKLTANLPQGALMNEGNAGIATCSTLGVLVSSIGCAFDVVRYSVALTISVNGQVVQTVNPSTVGSPTFVSFINPVGSEQDINLFVWLNGNTPPSSQATQAQSFLGGLCSGLCSIFNSGLLSNYVDLRSAVSQFQTSPFTVSINIQETYKAYQLYMSDVLNPATLSAGSLASYAYALAAYLTAPTNTVNVDNSATGPAWFWYTAPSCGLSCLSGTFATYTAPTRLITTDEHGNVIVVVTATSWTTCNSNGCAGFNERGYTVTIQTNPTGPPLQCALITSSWELWLLCQSTCFSFGCIPNWALVTIAILVLILFLWLAFKIPHKRRGKRGPYRKRVRATLSLGPED